MRTSEKFKSKDGVEYTLTVIKDIIRLRPEQILTLKKEISAMNSEDVESSRGISLELWREDQANAVLEAISSILKGHSVGDILDLELIDFTFHAQERKSDESISVQRDWDHKRIDYEIAECLKRSYKAEQVRIRFDERTKESFPKFSFTIWGFKNKNQDPGKLVIYFEDDPVEDSQTIMVVTILTP
jgi:hypothetical protein